jgi:hypothetical protein
MGRLQSTMNQHSHPPPEFLPLQKVLVVGKPLPSPGDGGILGEHGVVIWRSSYFVEKSRWGVSGWLYVVHFPQSDTYDGVEESRLVATDEVVALASCLGRDFEISYDRDGSGPEGIRGTFRIPGGFWNTFAFRSTAVEELSYEIRMPVRLYGAAIAKYRFAAPEAVLLDCPYIEGMMSEVFAAKQWRRIVGPKSWWFC